jgi:hypothetical protein
MYDVLSISAQGEPMNQEPESKLTHGTYSVGFFSEAMRWVEPGWYISGPDKKHCYIKGHQTPNTRDGEVALAIGDAPLFVQLGTTPFITVNYGIWTWLDPQPE